MLRTMPTRTMTTGIKRNRRITGVSALSLIASMILVTHAAAAPGDLDPTFGTGGIVRTANISYFEDMVVLADDKFVATGDAQDPNNHIAFSVARYNADGTLDVNFGTGGVVITQAGDPNVAFKISLPNAVAAQADGKIAVAGQAHDANNINAFAVVRYNADGTLDTGFDSDGIVRTQLSTESVGSLASGVAVQADGKIIAAGFSRDSMVGNVFAVVRYNVDGTLDNGFGTGGIVFTNSGTRAFDVVIQADGKVIVAGYGEGNNNDLAITLARYNSDGTLDLSFGSGGIVKTQASDPSAAFKSSVAQAVTLQADGQILVAGYANDANSDDAFAVVRYNPDGSLDTNFGTGGIALAQAQEAPLLNSFAYSLDVQSDGKIVTTGYIGDIVDITAIALVRFNSDGTLDTGFGDNGIVRTQAGDPNASFPLSYANSVGLQSNDKIIVAGHARNTNGDGAVLLRYDGTNPMLCLDLEPTSGCYVNGVADQVCVGTDGADIIFGTSGDDVIIGLAGDDVLKGLKGNDVICGNGGNDLILGNHGTDELSGGDDYDLVFGGFGPDIINGDGGDDHLYGNPGNDNLDGGAGFNFLNGGFGQDTCVNGNVEKFCH